MKNRTKKIVLIEEDFQYGTRCAPSILITFINMVLNKETAFEPACGSANMYAGQIGIQKLLLFCALICVPWMLLAKPIYIMRNRRKMNYSVSHQQMQSATENGDAELPIHNNTAQAPVSGGHGGGGAHEEPLGEIFIHQGIHTIEYVLGSVSHTASYLRLWALSLAHARKFQSAIYLFVYYKTYS